MLSSITPLGERGRGNRWGMTVTWFVTGSTIGGALAGALAGTIGHLLSLVVADRPRLAAVITLAAVALAVDGARRPGLLPSWRRQVDERWMDQYRAWVYGLGWGAQLGSGVLTIVSAASTYLVLAVAALVGSLPAGAALGLTFGLTRGLTLLTARRLSTAASLRTFHERLQGRRRFAAAAVVGSDALVLVAAAAALAQSPAGAA